MISLVRSTDLFLHERVAGQIGKIAMRTAQVVVGTLTPSRTNKRAPDLAVSRQATVATMWE